MANGDSFLPITMKELESHMAWANQVMKAAQWQPQRRLIRGEKGLNIDQISAPEQTRETVSLLALARELSGGTEILTSEVNRVLEAIRNGVAIGMYVSQQYVKRSGLEDLQQQNRSQQMSSAQQAEFNSKTTVASAIAIFVASSFIARELSSFEDGKVSVIKVDYTGVPELVFRSPQNAVLCSLYHFARYCAQESGVVNNGLEMVKLAVVYFSAVCAEIHDKAGSFAFKEPFDEVSYKLENSDFIVKGFKEIDHTAVASVEFRKVEFSEIVGNRRAKHLALRMAMMLCCYDLKRKRNPFLDVIKTWLNVRMGYGKPGTGKSLLIAAVATKMKELADKLGIPFLFHPMPAAIVSTFQGGSAERMEEWMRRLRDDDKIVYGPIDDAENNFMNRSREGVSAGVREVISVFLRNTEGASAIIRGNAVIDLMTNLPELIDPAVLSRIQARFPIDGARTFEDYLDQDRSWWMGFDKLDPKFVSMSNTSNYVFFEAQRSMRTLVDLENQDGDYAVRDPKIQEAIAIAEKKYRPDDHGFFGQLYLEVSRMYPDFSSRDLRNIQSAFDARVYDFDLPPEWFDDTKLFYELDYDRKVELHKQEVKKNRRGLEFSDSRRQEAYR